MVTERDNFVSQMDWRLYWVSPENPFSICPPTTSLLYWRRCKRSHTYNEWKERCESVYFHWNSPSVSISFKVCLTGGGNGDFTMQECFNFCAKVISILPYIFWSWLIETNLFDGYRKGQLCQPDGWKALLSVPWNHLFHLSSYHTCNVTTRGPIQWMEGKVWICLFSLELPLCIRAVHKGPRLIWSPLRETQTSHWPE